MYKYKPRYFLTSNSKITRIDWKATKLKVEAYLSTRSSSPAAAAMEQMDIMEKLHALVRKFGSKTMATVISDYGKVDIAKFLEKVDLGLFEESDTIKLINDILIFPEQEEKLDAVGVTINDALNGRIFDDKAIKVVNEIYAEWNKKMGRDFFILY